MFITAIKKTTTLPQLTCNYNVVQCIRHRQQLHQQIQIQQQQHKILQQYTRTCTTTTTVTTSSQQKEQKQQHNYQYQTTQNISFLQNNVNCHHNTLVIQRNFAIIRRRRGRGGQQDQATEQQQQQQQQKTTSTNPDNDDTDDEFDATIDEYDTNDNNTTPMLFNRPGLVIDKTIFQIESTKEISKLLKALEPLQYYNDIFVLEQSNTDDIGPCITIDIGPIHGKYTIQFDIQNTLQLQLISPLSGHYNYSCYLNIDSDTTTITGTTTSSSEWLSTIDGHHFEGMLVRDLIRQIQGVPNL